MNIDYLEFEQPIAELEQKIEELKRIGTGEGISIAEELVRLKEKSHALTESIFSHLTAHNIVSLARHPLRPYTKDYIEHIFEDWVEMHGDRNSDQGAPIIGGIARLDGSPVMVIGHQKGRTTKEKVERNFGMPTPQSFHKALRLMKLAERFSLPVITFIDTPGAYPGVKAEERNQSEAIARNLMEMSRLKVPVICMVIGEGCSGGALGLGVGDRLYMLQYSYYAVISPEGCASIIWKDASKAADASEAMNLTASRLKELELIDDIIAEPLGGAHRDIEKMSQTIKHELLHTLEALKQLPLNTLLEQRYQRWLNVGTEL
ncbi:MAG: acetyl-CoA carboxylase carboxyl transferase subunit alpha [Coxiellaceae bacterium]|nr:acetyl-CoA carboxylase carboxyl transferase subunit alpha [Coxiellaceae bacterium]